MGAGGLGGGYGWERADHVQYVHLESQTLLTGLDEFHGRAAISSTNGFWGKLARSRRSVREWWKKGVVPPCAAHESGGSARGALWQRGYELELRARLQWRTGERRRSGALTGGSHPQQSIDSLMSGSHMRRK
jgi:hypothetical protein